MASNGMPTFGVHVSTPDEYAALISIVGINSTKAINMPHP
jgi:hypothetical protein